MTTMAESRRRQSRLRFAEPAVHRESRGDGSVILRSPYMLNPPPRCLGTLLEGWASRIPERVFLAERDENRRWRELTYAEAWAAAQAIGQALLDRGLDGARPVMILSENSIEHALLALGAMHVGIPVAPVSTAYSRLSQDFGKLRTIHEIVAPGLIYAEDGERHGNALKALAMHGAELVLGCNAVPGLPATEFGSLLATKPGPAADAAHRALGPDTIAKILFTSGSTGDPKGVINTQRMLCANQESYVQLWPFLEERPPVLLDWMPWNHTFGGNSDFNMVLRNGGTLYIDDGKPTPTLIERSLANLREVSPTIYLNVPRGFAMVIDHLEREPELAERLFQELDLIFYAGAALPQSLWQRLEALSLKTVGHLVPMVSAWGTTETAPMATCVHYPMRRAGNIGLPAPGTEVKLAPEGDKLEIRVRGPNITPGYWKRPDLTRAAFDEEGFYRPGDAVRFADPDDPVKGLVFDGRIGENFKLSSGTWVTVGALRVAAIAAATPLIEDAVVTGHDRDEIGLLVFPSLAGCRSLSPELGPEAPIAVLVRAPAIREALAAALQRHNANAGGSSQRITRVLLLDTPASIDNSEITDKGYINQRAVLMNRAPLVERLYMEPPGPDVILPEAN
ncbi:MAG: feruloyl-CoA synthase [Proteobacteria bacterium]|nr:feruloyl-CoA synthase [Pseudomonadota bacterium]MBI3496246.1 feruloyl-CoA synthase [Pseudomonadota bacterium]